MFSVNAMKWNELKFCKADRDMKVNATMQLQTPIPPLYLKLSFNAVHHRTNIQLSLRM